MKSHGLTLYEKEFKASRFENVISTAGFAVLLLIAYILANTGRIPNFIPIGLAFLPIAVWPLVAIVQGVNSIRNEWTGKTVYLLNTLPVPGWKIIASKLASIMTGYAFTTILGSVAGVLMAKAFFGIRMEDLMIAVSTGDIINMILLAYGLFTLLIVCLTILSQLSYLVSTLVERFSWMVFGVTFFTGMWVIIRVGGTLGWLFTWLPTISIPSIHGGNGMVETVSEPLHPGVFVGVAIMTFLLFLGASHIIEKEAEV